MEGSVITDFLDRWGLVMKAICQRWDFDSSISNWFIENESFVDFASWESLLEGRHKCLSTLISINVVFLWLLHMVLHGIIMNNILIFPGEILLAGKDRFLKDWGLDPTDIVLFRSGLFGGLQFHIWILNFLLLIIVMIAVLFRLNLNLMKINWLFDDHSGRNWFLCRFWCFLTMNPRLNQIIYHCQ